MAIPQLQGFVQAIEMARARYVYGLEQVPEDRLNWSPGGAARTPLTLAARACVFLSVISQVLETGVTPDRSAMRPPMASTREEAIEALNAGYRRLAAAVDGLTEADLKKNVTAPWGAPVPLEGMLWFFAGAIGYQQGQINYLQTAYGDENPNIPPEWKQQATNNG